MASLPYQPCLTPGCRALVRGTSRCEAHASAVKVERHRASEAVREQSSTQRGYDNDWRKLRAQHVAKNPTCQCGRPVEVVHHVHDIAQHPNLRLSTLNLQSLCRECHHAEHLRTGVPTYTSKMSAHPYPDALGKFIARVTVVCGAPASGKTYYVKASAKPGDVVLDLDEIAARLSGKETHSDNAPVLRAALRVRNDALFTAARGPGPDVWLISSSPKQEQRDFWRARGARVVELHTTRAECEERIRRERRDVARQLIVSERYWSRAVARK